MSTPESGKRIYFTNLILIGKICERSRFKMTGIDELFTTHGADPNWWTKAPIPIHNSRHIDRVSGWLSGITKFAPEKTGPIMLAVLKELKDSGSIVSAEDRRLVSEQIARIETFLGVPPSESRARLDQRVLDAAGPYWASRHFTKAVQNTFVALIEAVKAKAEVPDKDGDGLMRHVFSPEKPILRISDIPSEQRGYMDLFAGSVGAIRNPLSHTAQEVLTFEEASERLSLASLLFRVLDKAVKVQ